jgi:hypothetical protein
MTEPPKKKKIIINLVAMIWGPKKKKSYCDDLGHPFKPNAPPHPKKKRLYCAIPIHPILGKSFALFPKQPL